MITTPIMLIPRFRIFQQQQQQEEEEQQITMIKPVAPWLTQQLSSSKQQVVVTTTTTTITQPIPYLLSAPLNKSLSVLSVSNNDNDDDADDDDDANDDDDDDWGIFVSFGDADGDEVQHDREYKNNYDCYSPLYNRSHLPVFAEGLWKQCIYTYIHTKYILHVL